MSRHAHCQLFSALFLLFAGIVLIGRTALHAQTPQSASTSSESTPVAPGEQPAFGSEDSNAAGNTGTNLIPDGVPNFGGPGMRGGVGSSAFNGGVSNPFGSGTRSGFRSMGGSANSGSPLGPMPSFNQMMHGGLSLPMNSSFGNFRFSYQSPFSLSNSLQMNTLNGYGAGFATYESPHARSGRIDFSASAKVGMGSANGMSNYGSDWMNQGGPGGHGPGGHGAADQPSTAVSFRLKF
jgi:hypothetical protein